jgi:hypothetical protein
VLPGQPFPSPYRQQHHQRHPRWLPDLAERQVYSQIYAVSRLSGRISTWKPMIPVIPQRQRRGPLSGAPPSTTFHLRQPPWQQDRPADLAAVVAVFALRRATHAVPAQRPRQRPRQHPQEDQLPGRAAVVAVFVLPAVAVAVGPLRALRAQAKELRKVDRLHRIQ